MHTFAHHQQYTILSSKGVELTLSCPAQPGYCYLIHFKSKLGNLSNPHGTAQHYLGSAIDLEARLQLHRNGNGSKIMAAVNQAGIEWEISRVWECESPIAARLLEHKLKRTHGHGPVLCPICNPKKPACPRAMRLAGHFPFSLFSKPGKRQPMGTPRPVYLH